MFNNTQHIQLLSQFTIPKFDNIYQKLEFYHKTAKQKQTMRKYFLLIGCLSFLLYGILDIYSGQDNIYIILNIRVTCVIFMLMITLIFFIQAPLDVPRLPDILISIFLFCPSLAIIWMTLIVSEGTAADTYPFGLTILYAYGSSLLSPRAKYLNITFFTSFIIYLFSIPFSNISSGALIANLFFIVFGMLAICVGSIAREKLEKAQSDKDATLQKLNDDMAASKLEALEARDVALEAKQVQANFISNLSHELRTPLNAILGFSEIMDNELHGKLSPSIYRQYVKDIHWSGKSLLLLINDLLDIRHLDQGKFKWSSERFSINDMLSNAVMVCDHRAKHSGVTVNFEPLPVAFDAQGDSIRMSQAIANLIINSIKFSKDGDAVNISQGLVSSGEYRITISDNGIGIHADHLQEILQPFVQIKESVALIASEDSGLGLGLTISAGIFKRMGARFKIESELSAGTSCHIYIPADCLYLDNSNHSQVHRDNTVLDAKVVSLRL